MSRTAGGPLKHQGHGPRATGRAGALVASAAGAVGALGGFLFGYVMTALWYYLRLPYAELIRHTPQGIPYLRPEVVLLFKAKAAREKDRADFDGVLPLLSAAQRRWLDDALGLVHPTHEWRRRLR
ncbi:hypothetical protein MRQ36_32395 [Micromonospora sp. R77]|uniref:hypothetical protein n=1 Tax=Micromonospora sp. R77 TaxID=2925836 RepID=UPI001F616503|nr:hypothetical protein [Micromonospora sp. R77]MCI4067015.1 hypothetical protein [Micromonospora sp. R77]